MSTVYQRAAATILAGLLASSVAHAQVPFDVETAHREGMALREQHHDQEALAVFRRIYDRTHEPRALARMGLAEGELGQWVAAEEHLLGALAASEDPWVVANQAALHVALTQLQVHLGDLVVRSDAPGAEVWIQGARFATLPHPDAIRRPVGAVTVEIRAPGFVTETRTVAVTATGSVPLNVSLRAAPHTAPAVTAPAVVVAPVVPLRTEHAAPDGTLRTLAWTTAIGGGLFLVVGAAALAIGSSAAANWNNDSACLVAGAGTRMTQCGSSQSLETTMAVLAPIGLVGGGLMAVGSVIFFVASPSAHSGEHGPSATALRCGPGPGALGVACGVSF